MTTTMTTTISYPLRLVDLKCKETASSHLQKRLQAFQNLRTHFHSFSHLIVDVIANMCHTIFVDFDIYHGMAAL